MEEKEKGKEKEEERGRGSEKEMIMMTSPVKEQKVGILVPIVPQSQVLLHFDTHHLMKSS